MMRKMLLLLFVLSLFVLIAGCGSSDKEKNATIILKANDVHTDDYPTTQSTKYMGKLLEERSNGRIKLQIYSLLPVEFGVRSLRGANGVPSASKKRLNIS